MKKKKTPAASSAPGDKNVNGEEVAENHLDQEDVTKSSSRGSKPMRGGRKGGAIFKRVH